ncbi:MAG: hypothetical protein WCI71_07955 [Bacteroidota bacterium]
MFAINTCHSQQDKAALHLKSNGITFTIKQNRCKYISITSHQEGDSLKSFAKSVEGKFISSTSLEIIMTPSYSKTSRLGYDSLKQNTETFYPLNYNPISLKVKDISVIGYQSKSAHNCLVAGKILMTIGIITTFIVAPLASINYNTGSINSQRYYTLAATGLGLYVVSIPLFILSKEKKFYLKLPKNSKEKVWRLDN